MGVDLRRRDIGVAEHLLHAAQIGAAVEEVTGKGVAQHMRREARRIESGTERQLLQKLADPLPGQKPALAARRKQPARRLALFEKFAADIEVFGESLAR